MNTHIYTSNIPCEAIGFLRATHAKDFRCSLQPRGSGHETGLPAFLHHLHPSCPQKPSIRSFTTAQQICQLGPTSIRPLPSISTSLPSSTYPLCATSRGRSLTMLMQRAASRLHTLSSTCPIISRSYSLTSTAQSRFRAPSLADITPESAATFDARQREFRERLVAEQNERKRKEQAESQSTFPFPSMLTYRCGQGQLKKEEASEKGRFHLSSTALRKGANSTKTLNAPSPKSLLEANTCTRSYFTR